MPVMNSADVSGVCFKRVTHVVWYIAELLAVRHKVGFVMLEVWGGRVWCMGRVMSRYRVLHLRGLAWSIDCWELTHILFLFLPYVRLVLGE